MASALDRQLGPYSRPVPGPVFNGFGAVRSLVLGFARIISAALPVAAASAAPLLSPGSASAGHDAFGLFGRAAKEEPEEGADVVVLYVASIALVLLGGAFAGLTIALMGQDSIYLQVLARDETDPQQKNARRVYDLLQRGKHWVLVTLLLSNVIVNETLPVVLDRCLGGGVAAVVGSTVLIVIFGEVLPQSICVRYGLQIGGIMSKPVLCLMWLLAPIAWPTAKLLDHALGEDHGTVYKKSGLKTLVTLHRSLGEVSERLNQDEVTIISAVLDLKEKPVSSVMTPMEDVFTMSEDTVLDEPMMDLILSAGYSRIPIHEPGNPTNFIGMLLVKILITYDPDDKVRVSEFPLATLPETRPETSCLDIVNFFQEGKSHMVIVSQYPGEDHGALGVVTLEDVIEELIGEEIIDESDVYIDVHKAIRRLQPAPRARPLRHKSLVSEMKAAAAAADAARLSEDAGSHSETGGLGSATDLSRVDSQTAHATPSSPKLTTMMLRRRSQGADGRISEAAVPVRTSVDEMWQHLRHLGPSNPATNPKNTRSTTVKIKTSLGPRNSMTYGDTHGAAPREDAHADASVFHDEEDDETTHLLKPDDDGDFDGTRNPQEGYGTYGAVSDSSVLPPERNIEAQPSAPETKKDSATAVPVTVTAVVTAPSVASASEDAGEDAGGRDTDGKDRPGTQSTSVTLQHDDGNTNIQLKSSRTSAADATRRSGSESGASGTNILLTVSDQGGSTRRSIVRSGSITENVIETRGIRKVILETTSSADDDDEAATSASQSSRPRRRLLSGLHSPAVTSAPVSDVEQDRPSAEGARTSQESVAGPSSDAAAASQQGGAPQQGGAGGGKKKNRRKKRKGSKT